MRKVGSVVSAWWLQQYMILILYNLSFRLLYIETSWWLLFYCKIQECIFYKEFNWLIYLWGSIHHKFYLKAVSGVVQVPQELLLHIKHEYLHISIYRVSSTKIRSNSSNSWKQSTKYTCTRHPSPLCIRLLDSWSPFNSNNFTLCQSIVYP